MPVALDTDLVLLHQLRLKGVATAEAVAAGALLPATDTHAGLARLVAEGLAAERAGRVPGFALTADGRLVHAQRVAAELDRAGAAGTVARCHRSFLVHNAEVVAACTAWQVRDLSGHVRNDHADAAYDRAVLARLGRVHEAAVPVCDALATALPRFAVYVPRLRAALDQVRQGRHEWCAQPLIDSYHTVWMELHEDLLVTLRIERSSETAS